MLRIVASDGAPGFATEAGDALTPDTAEGLRRRGVCGTTAESQKKFKKLKETFERRLDTAERVEEEDEAAEQHDDKGLEFTMKARIEMMVRERMDAWSEALLQEQEKVRAKAEKALDVAEESSRACWVVAKQLQDAGDLPLCTQAQVQTMIQQALDAVQFLKPNNNSSEGDQGDAKALAIFSDGGTSPRTVAKIMDDLHHRLEEWVSAIESRVCAVEQTLWSLNLGTASGGAERHGSDLPPAEPEAISQAMQKLHNNVDSLAGACTVERDSARHLGRRLQHEIDEINTKLQELNAVALDSGVAIFAEGRSLADVKRELSNIKDSVKVQAATLESIQREAYSPGKKKPDQASERRQNRGSSCLTAAKDVRGPSTQQLFARRGVSVDIRAAATAMSAPGSRVPEAVQLGGPSRRQAPQANHTHPAQLQGCGGDGGGLAVRASDCGLSVRASPLSERRTVHRRASAPVFPPPAGWRWGVVSVPTSRQVSPNSHTMRFSPNHERPAPCFQSARRQHGMNCWSPGSTAASVEMTAK